MRLSRPELRTIVFLLQATPLALHEIARKYTVDTSTIENINMGKEYASFTRCFGNTYPLRQKPLKSTFAQIVKVLQTTSYSYEVIGKKFNLDAEVIEDINKGTFYYKPILKKMGITALPVRLSKKTAQRKPIDAVGVKLYSRKTYEDLIYYLQNTTLNTLEIGALLNIDPSVVGDLNKGNSFKEHKLALEKLGITKYPIRPFKVVHSSKNMISSNTLINIPKGQQTKVIELLSTTRKSYKDIAQETGVDIHDVEKMDNMFKILRGDTEHITTSTVARVTPIPTVYKPKKTPKTLSIEVLGQIAQLLKGEVAQYKIAVYYGITPKLVSDINKGIKYKAELKTLGITKFPIRVTKQLTAKKLK